MYQDAHKGALAFILNPPSSSASGSDMGPYNTSPTPTLSPTRKSHSSADEDVGMETADDTASDNDDDKRFHIQGRNLLASGSTLMETRVHQLLSHGNHHGKMRVRKASICAQIDCPRAAVSRGRCVRHGVRFFIAFFLMWHGAMLTRLGINL